MSYSMQRVQSERDSRLQGRGECIAAVSGWLWEKKDVEESEGKSRVEKDGS